MIYDSIVIGAGVIGCAVIRELTKSVGKFALLEKEEDICMGTSKANSAIIHAGFDAKNGTLMAKMNVKGNEMMDKISEELDIPFKRIGALVLCFDKQSLPKLEELYERGVKNNVKGLKVVSSKEALLLEPTLAEEVCGALWAPTSGVVCPFEMTAGYGENAAMNGADFIFQAPVINIEKENDIFKITTAKGDYFAKSVINCAGVFGGKIHSMVCADEFAISPRRGEYVLCDKEVGNFASKTLFQLPTALGKGILVSPTVHGNLLLGPTADDVDDLEGVDTTELGLETVLKKAALSVKNLPMRQAITSFAGLRAHTNQDEFTLNEPAPLYFEAIGIESPGLSSAPAIGEYMAEMISKALGLAKNNNFIPHRKGVIKAAELPFEQRAQLIKDKPDYGQIICRCEMISEGEILSAIHRPLGAKTLDGVKRRTRAGMGRCQSGFCSPKVMGILARELGASLEEISKKGKGSELVLQKTNKGGEGNE